MGCRRGYASGKVEQLAKRPGEVVSGTWLGWCEGAELESLSMTEFGLMLRDNGRREVKLSIGRRLGKTLCEMGCVKMLDIALYIQMYNKYSNI